MSRFFMDIATGEVLTPSQMLAVYQEEYDGSDDTNLVAWDEYFEEVFL